MKKRIKLKQRQQLLNKYLAAIKQQVQGTYTVEQNEEGKLLFVIKEIPNFSFCIELPRKDRGKNKNLVLFYGFHILLLDKHRYTDATILEINLNLFCDKINSIAKYPLQVFSNENCTTAQFNAYTDLIENKLTFDNTSLDVLAYLPTTVLLPTEQTMLLNETQKTALVELQKKTDLYVKETKAKVQQYLVNVYNDNKKYFNPNNRTDIHVQLLTEYDTSITRNAPFNFDYVLLRYNTVKNKKVSIFEVSLEFIYTLA